MKKAVYFCLVLFFQTLCLSAQTPVCIAPNTSAADDCAAACIYCQLNGYTGQTAGYTASTAPDFCSTATNDQWLAFIAGNNSITITVSPSNCQQGDGLETALYSSCTAAPLACTPGQQGSGNLPSTVSAALTPGQTYFLRINGYGGDVCNFEITTSPANAVQAPQVGPIGPVQGPTVVAENSSLSFSVDSSVYATSYRWTGPSSWKINGQTPPVELTAPAGRQVTVTFGNEGGVLSAQAINACSQSAVSSQRIFLGKAPLAPPCPSSATPAADFCGDACVFCNFTGYAGSSTGYTADTVSGFCGLVENNQWIGFVAGVPAATFTLTASNCADGNGLQMALYQNCTDPPLVCAGGKAGGASEPVLLTASLQPGQNYFLMVDGYFGDQCDFSLTVNPPMAGMPPPLSPISLISGPAQLCPGATVAYTVPVVSGAAGYTWDVPTGWLINGQPGPYSGIGAGSNSVTVTAGATGGQIVVYAFNSCAVGSPVVKTIAVQAIPPTVFPPVVLCNEDTPYMLPWGVPCFTSGVYETTLSSYLGCDSVLRQQVTVKLPIVTNLPPRTICAGGSLEVCGETFSSGGSYSAVCTSYLGCDSVVNFSLLVLDPVAQILPTQNINCAVPPLVLQSSPSPGIKTWKLLTGEVVGAGNSLAVTQARTYILVVTASAGGSNCTAVDTIVVTFNSPPTAAAAAAGILTCNQSSVQLDGASTTPAALYTWSGPDNFSSTEEDPVVTAPGNYVLTVTDPQTGCTTTASTVVLEDVVAPVIAPLGNLSFNCIIPFVELPCPPLSSGYSCSWSGPGLVISPAGQFQAVDSGFYQLVVTGPNGCTSTAEVWVEADIQAPVITAYADTITCLNPNTMVHCSVDIPGVPCLLFVTGNGYLVTATALNGCTSTATVVVPVDVNVPLATATGDTLRCDQPSVTLTCTTNVAGALFEWSGPGGFSSTLQNPEVSQPGVYQVSVTDPGNGCMSVATATVVADDQVPQVLVAQPAKLTCAQPTVTLFTTVNQPQTSFQWLGPDGFTSDLPNPEVSMPGIYTVTAVVAGSGCSGTALVVVEQDTTPPALALVQVTNDLNGQGLGAIDLSVLSPATYSVEWSLNGTPFANSEDLSGLMAGVYSAVVTGSNGCTSTLEVTVLDSLVSTHSVSTDQFWEIFPNPVRSILKIRYLGNDRPDVRFLLFNAAGQTVLEQKEFGTALWTLSCTQLPPGMYTLLIQTKEGVARKPVAILR